ncbi:SMC family ATPase [Desulfuromonas carbonis]|uniref:AAA family ATPase n=1 Tax=Desulfuromonas sp. DDH964 TaxID=1823759 RepID=UPI00078EB7B4|nr:SMC family ATPase [Desulfuromonas sp. DDH964]AMV71634.1 Nuclease SbcCD subunit C [Desulfuromonas sp. DDH964]
MRPLRLTMTAFGPFPGAVQIDFTRLGENPLFLINGPTGSGKTTILDAFCFALYGRTTGDEREGAQMRCDLAASDTLTEVVFEFELAGRRFSVRRSPEQQRPKARGEGFTTQAPEAELKELLEGGGVKLIVASKVSEATREIEELTGLSVDQFRQVMVLPQGQFRQLLMADSGAREKIFGQLFQTRIYRRLEESLKARAAEIRRERERQLQLQQGMLEGASLASPEALEAELAELEPVCVLAKVEKETKERAFSEAEKRLLQARNTEQQFHQLEKAARDLKELEADRPRIDAERSRIDRAEQARKLQPLFSDRSRCERELELARRKAAEAEGTFRTGKTALEQATRKKEISPRLQAELKQAAETLTRLQGYGERVGKLATARAAAEGASRDAAAADLLVRFKLLADSFLTLHQQEQQARQVEEYQQRLQAAREKEAALRRAYEECNQRTRVLELEWHQGQAAILARELQAGTPCPVCGSLEHPSPARTDRELPDQQQLETARRTVQEAFDRLDTAKLQTAREQESLRDLQRQAENLGTTVKPGTTLAGLKEEIAAVQREAKVSAFDLPDREQVQRLAAEQLRAERETRRAASAAARAQVETAGQELPEAYREEGALAAAVAETTRTIGQIEGEIRGLEETCQQAQNHLTAAKVALEAAEEQQERARAALTETQNLCASALAASPFADEAEYRAALLDEAVLQQLKQQVSVYDSSCQRLAGAQEQLTLQLEGIARPDLERLETASSSARAERDDTGERWRTLDNRLLQLKTTKNKLAKAAADREELDRQYAVVGTLSDVANGQTGNKISLQRFVLSVLLDDVLVEASRRLTLMSKGRYQLLRKEERAKGNKASGLELEVEDAYTGKQRPVATLSGGESFMAALALALGLSDVVQAYAGGIRLDTLFIDEGFGSLDAESLELAIRTLVDLQATGRMVGIISHVAELKEQLPLRIDVLASRAGSSVAVVTP